MADNAQLIIRKAVDLNVGDYVWNWYIVLSPDVTILIGPVSDYSVTDAATVALRLHKYFRKSRAFGTMEGHYVQ